MENNNQILNLIEKLRGKIDEKQAKSLELDLLTRIVIRLQSFDCNECKRYLAVIEEYIHYLDDNKDLLNKQKLKEYSKEIQIIKTHLQKEHGLYIEGTFMAVYMSIGMSIGIVFGLTIFDNLALGLPIGLSLGIAVGTGIDADLKKKGKTI